jgi:hypothetical protein
MAVPAAACHNEAGVSSLDLMPGSCSLAMLSAPTIGLVCSSDAVMVSASLLLGQFLVRQLPVHAG